MKVLLEQIEIYAGTQARQGIDQETVDRYAERMIEGDVFPPVVLFHDGSINNEFVDIEAAKDAQYRKGIVP